eukprot:CAMPEP_0198302392 /NCGR_PEP_ID=MMETSP1449-20131203/54996_1 /TAXON_ID=420275 /ORGANISM="Attheya septentrionalis, Strain CCMP2084" /LENGTH=69 /DNA_ID=CAMNT_0044004729 /DNA_START=125 /DNA_END=330 /DNA_ORIENTATION=+
MAPSKLKSCEEEDTDRSGAESSADTHNRKTGSCDRSPFNVCSASTDGSTAFFLRLAFFVPSAQAASDLR